MHRMPFLVAAPRGLALCNEMQLGPRLSDNIPTFNHFSNPAGDLTAAKDTEIPV